jgi:hypothetical protein
MMSEQTDLQRALAALQYIVILTRFNVVELRVENKEDKKLHEMYVWTDNADHLFNLLLKAPPT